MIISFLVTLNITASQHDAVSKPIFAAVQFMFCIIAHFTGAIITHHRAVIINESVQMLPRGHAVIVTRKQENLHLAIYGHTTCIGGKNGCILKGDNFTITQFQDDGFIGAYGSAHIAEFHCLSFQRVNF
nr:MAG TPA: hypothetical protein [Caudoviricetes sp.]